MHIRENKKQQTVIVDPAVTGETDELDPRFHQQSNVPEDSEDEEIDKDDEA